MRAHQLFPLACTVLLALGCAPAALLPVTPSGTAASVFTAVDLAPPPADQGVQVTVGPFDVPAGTELQRNFFVKLPTDKDVMINRVQIAFPKGSHHTNVFKTDRAFPDHVEDTFDAVDYNTFQMFAAAQIGNLDWKYPTGVGLALAKQQQLLVQTHWVNAATQQTPGGKGQVKMNFWFAKPGEITTNLGLAFIINKNLDLLPHTTTMAKKIVDLAGLGFKQDYKILAMTGHFHSRGKAFELNRYDGTTAGEQIYRSDNWDEPPFKRFDQPVEVKSGEKLLYTSTFVNNTDMLIKFGPHVENQEHSNLFMYFVPGPADGKAIYDVAGTI
jgi:hypothetical protein